MGLEEHIARGRAQGRSDEEILGAIQGFAPQYKEHIERGVANGRSASEIINATSAYDTKFGKSQEAEAKPLLNRVVDGVLSVTDPFRQSLANDLKGYAATGRVLNGERNDSNQGLVNATLQGAGDLIAPDPARYKPADVAFDNLGDIPKAVAEGSTSLLTDLPAMATGARLGAAGGAALGSVVPVVGTGIGAIGGGLIGGFGGLAASMFARSHGDNSNRRALARTGDPTVQPTSEDQRDAVLALLPNVALNQIGLKYGLGKAATAGAGSVAKQVGLQAGTAAGMNAATGVAGEAIDQTLLDKEYNGRRLQGAGLTSAATGGALRVLGGYSDVNASRKFGDITPEQAAVHLTRMQAIHGDDIPDTPQKSFEVMSKARRDLAGEIKTDTSDANFKALLEDQTTKTPLVGEAYVRVRDDIAAKKAPSPTDMEILKQSIGQFGEGAKVLKGFEEQVVSDKIIGMKGANYDEKAGTFAGGAAASPFAQKYLNPIGGHTGSYLAAGAALFAAGGHTIPGLSALHSFANPTTALALPAAMGGIYGTLKAGGKFTGNADPLKLFRERYSDSQSNPGAALPRFADVLDQEAAAGGLEKQRSKALEKQVVDESRALSSAEKALEKQRSSALEKQVVDTEKADMAALKKQAQSANALERQRSRALEKQVVDADNAEKSAVASLEKQRMGELGKLAVMRPRSDAVVNIRVAKMVQEMKAREAAGEPTVPTAPMVPPQAPKAAGEAPRRPSVEVDPRDPTFDINTKSGTRKQSIADTKSQKAYGNAVKDNEIARRDIFTEASNIKGLSETAQAMLSENLAKLTKRVFKLNDPDVAMGEIERFIQFLPKADRAALRNHFADYVDPVINKTFAETWPPKKPIVDEE